MAGNCSLPLKISTIGKASYFLMYFLVSILISFAGICSFLLLIVCFSNFLVLLHATG